MTKKMTEQNYRHFFTAHNKFFTAHNNFLTIFNFRDIRTIKFSEVSSHAPG